MKDPRIDQLAKQLVQHSVKLQKGEKVLIEMIGDETELIKALVKQVNKVGATPYVTLKKPEITRALLMEATEEQLKDMASWELERMKTVDAYIGIRSGNNVNELSDVPDEKMKLYSKYFLSPVHFEERVNRTRWVILRYPNPSMAQLANKSTEAFEDFYFNVCNLDYGKMSKAMDALVELMNKTDKVHIKGEGTDLTFSIKGIPAIKCAGEMNIPDGEVYTAPVKDSVNGYITYNAPTLYEGVTYENIRLEFKDGKIIKATANDTERINKVFDTDEGARYVGEFAIGVNPYILDPMKDILFDEKIAGSIHFTPGKAYEDADNGNRSDIHWDLVYIQRPEYGGGEIYFDDVLIRKDGRFVTPELEPLNPENLK
ncbi:aminopeptidase [Vulcanibacillus modesticaldus]|uniref:Aminopeptidase n=1 Tax=Vulcanibacillus modesticaldus TaxID=337097 RepID=A0A1D2YU48_9BACI|nr:aminopeptidase [Vulcanibacillus modesticaldus]OEF99181.1 aminopeptidase [Vulcanibacillus modesticaldus]